MDQVDIAWLAGIVEGEGSFIVRSSHTGIRVRMTDLDIIKRLQQITGAGTLSGPRRGGKSPKQKSIYDWLVTRRHEVARILFAVYPLLGERRRKRAADVAERLSRLPKATSRGAKCCRRGHTHAWKLRRDGKRRCAECDLINHQEYYARNREKALAYAREYRGARVFDSTQRKYALP